MEAEDQDILGFLAREAHDPNWSPLASARRLINRAGSDLALLREASAWLLSSSPAHPSTAQVRARATLVIAVAELEDALGVMGDLEVTGGPTVPLPRTPTDAAP